MSSLVNETTGKCISGTCTSMQLFENISWWGWLGIILIGSLLITVGYVLTSQNIGNKQEDLD